MPESLDNTAGPLYWIWREPVLIRRRYDLGAIIQLERRLC